MAKTQEELKNMVNRLVDTGRKYGMEITVDKSQVMKIFKKCLLYKKNQDEKFQDQRNVQQEIITLDNQTKSWIQEEGLQDRNIHILDRMPVQKKNKNNKLII